MNDDEITYDEIIGRVREKLNCESDRISHSPAAFRLSWWPNVPDFHDELLSDYGVTTKYVDLEKEFREEIQAIHNALNTLEHEKGITDSHKSSLDQVAIAYNIWDRIAMPIRRKGQTVYRIWSPRDVNGSPIIKALPVDFFIKDTAYQTASYRIEIEQLKKTVDKWRIAAIILGTFVGLYFLTWVL